MGLARARPYAFALSSHAAYWLMEGTLFVTALLMWQSILARWSHPGAVSIALLGSVVQMGMLGALITFSRPGRCMSRIWPRPCHSD